MLRHSFARMAVAGAAIALTVALVTQGGRTHIQPRSPTIGPRLGTFADFLQSGRKPSPTAIEATPEVAQENLGRPILVPNASPASLSCLRDLWIVPESQGHVVMVFSTDVAVYLDPERPHDFQAEAASEAFSALATVGQVAGNPALIIEARGAGGLNPGSVTFNLAGYTVGVFGYYPSSELMLVANSIQTLGSAVPVGCQTPNDSLFPTPSEQLPIQP